MSKRSWKSKLAELLLWAAVAIATAVVLIMLTDKILPEPNF
jgi:hypothetical protein